MYPSTRMLAHSRAPHIFSHTYPSDMACSPPPGKVHRMYLGTAPSTLFPISPVQHYISTTDVVVYSRYCVHTVLYSCRGTLVLVVLECTSTYGHFRVHSRVHCCISQYTSTSVVYGMYTLLVYSRIHSVQVCTHSCSYSCTLQST
jgi:hypothetical protein